MRHDQSTAIVRLLVEKTEPPLAQGQYEQYLVLYQLAKLPTSELKPLFDDHQWALLQQQLVQGRAWEQTLMQQGLIAKTGHEEEIDE